MLKPLILKTRIIKPNEHEINLPARSRIFLLDWPTAGRDLKIKIGPQSQVQYLSVYDPASGMIARGKRDLIVGANSRVDIFSAYFGGAMEKFELNHYLGEGGQVNSRVLFWLKGEEDLRVQDNYIFTATGTAGRFRIEGLLDDKSRAQYYSDVVIKPAAQETDSRIDMRLHLLGPQAAGQILPGLKIAANRVKAGHGASTFRLDPEDIFYLRSRGLSPAAIKALIVNSVANQFAGTLSDSRIKNKLIKLIQSRA